MLIFSQWKCGKLISKYSSIIKDASQVSVMYINIDTIISRDPGNHECCLFILNSKSSTGMMLLDLSRIKSNSKCLPACQLERVPGWQCTLGGNP